MGKKLPIKPPKKYSGPFMEVSRIGFCENGKARGCIQFSGKRTIERDPSRPLSCFLVPLIKDLIPLLSYENADQLTEDVATVKEMLDRLEFESPK